MVKEITLYALYIIKYEKKTQVIIFKNKIKNRLLIKVRSIINKNNIRVETFKKKKKLFLLTRNRYG